MLIDKRRFTRGDTIIEVMLAFVVFSMTIVGAFSLMNRGIAIAQRSLEMTQVRQQIDSQILLLKYAQKNPTLWASVKNKITAAGSVVTLSSMQDKCPLVEDLVTKKAFFMNRASSGVALESISGSNYTAANTYSKVNFDIVGGKAEGIFVQIAQAENASGTTNRAYDIYVNACWESIGTNIPMTTGTVVRLYDAGA
ncbi:MAG: hypothetical protein WAQ22_03270 [Candidatus Saccharimonas sp.]